MGMVRHIDDYAMIGDCETAALVSREGSIDWLCLPRFDSVLQTPVPLRGEQYRTVGELTVDAGDRVPFVLTWHPSHTEVPVPVDAESSLRETLAWWREWSARCSYRGEWREAVVRSLVTLKGLTYAPTGALVAAPTMALPERLGGERNWDYRYCWLRDDEGIWEVRGARRHFTHSKVMAWLAFDRAVKGIERFGLDGPADRWRSLRDAIHADICQRGFDREVGAFVQAYGSKELDASLLILPLVGFLPPTDPRIGATVEAIERHLTQGGWVMRYRTESGVDGLAPGEGAFLLCSFWLADNLYLRGRVDEARRLFGRLLSARNDVGLLPEQIEPITGHALGNFPQAFSHVALVNTAKNLSTNVPSEQSPGEERGRE